MLDITTIKLHLQITNKHSIKMKINLNINKKWNISQIKLTHSHKIILILKEFVQLFDMEKEQTMLIINKWGFR